MCGPCKLIKNHFSVPVQWLNLVELNDDYANGRGVGDGAGPHRGDAFDGRARPRVGEGGGRPLLHVPRAVRPVQRATLIRGVARARSRGAVQSL